MFDCRSSRRAASTIAVFFLVFSGCTSGGPDGTLEIDLIDEAISAVDAHFGEESSFYEINATSDGVNLFVSRSDPDADPTVVQARYTSADGLVISDTATPSQGSVFSGSAVEFDPKTIVERAVGELASAEPKVFIITAAANSEEDTSDVSVSYRLVMESQRGGRLVVFLGRDGTILGSDLME